MSYNGSGTFNINSTGQPVVAGTVITASAFNALTTDLATGLTTAITKDGQTTTTARITFAQGITSSLVTDSSSVSTGSIITAGGAGIAKNLYVGVNANVAGTLGVTGVATFSAAPIYSSLTASSAVATDASKGLVSVTNTGTGNNVLATSPTITTPTISSLSSASATALTLQSAGTTAITVDTSQNVGIGTTSIATIDATGKTLEVYGGAGGGFIHITNSTTGQTVSDGFIIGTQIGGSDALLVQRESANMIFRTADTERMRIDSSGNVGIGTSSPSEKFEVSGTVVASGLNTRITNTDTDASARAAIQFKTGASSNVWQTFAINGNLTTGVAGVANYMTLNSSGRLLINSPSNTDGMVTIKCGGGAAGLAVVVASNGDNAVNWYNASNTYVSSIVVNSGTVAYNTSSDYRLKENIAPMAGALATVAQLNPVTWNWKTDGKSGQGFIAHELQTVVPDAVTGEKDAVETYTDENGNQQTRPKYQGIDTSFLVATLTAAIQELKTLNDALTARIVALESK